MSFRGKFSRVRIPVHAMSVMATGSLALLISGCGAGRLERLLPSRMPLEAARAETRVSFQTLPPEAIDTHYKFLFIVDESSSNCADDLTWNSATLGCKTTGISGIGTDPTGGRRFDPIVQFANSQTQLRGNANTEYAMIRFNNSQGLVTGFTDSATFNPLVSSEKTARQDYNRTGLGTNYNDPLNAAFTLINTELSRCAGLSDPDPATYIIYFISDGKPTLPCTTRDSITGTCVNPTTNDLVNQATAIVQSIQDLSARFARCSTGIYLHTGYYYADGANDAEAETGMTRLAQTGKGQMLQFNGTDPIDLTQFKVPAQQVQMSLVNLYIKNMNLVWEGGELKLDSDGDGLSDELEFRLGSNPYNRDSDGNGVSDLVEYKAYGAPCLDIRCRPTYSRDFATCAAFRSSAPGVSPVVFKDTDLDGLNDCEEQAVLKTRIDRWDSNGNWIPDLLEFMAGMNPISGTDQSNEDPDNDGVTNKEEIRLGTSIFSDNGRVLNFKPNEYTLIEAGRGPNGIQYQLDIRNIPLIGEHNQVRIYLLESSSGVKDTRFIRVAEKTVSLEQGAQFSNADFGTPYQFSCSVTDACR